VHEGKKWNADDAVNYNPLSPFAKGEFRERISFYHVPPGRGVLKKVA